MKLASGSWSTESSELAEKAGRMLTISAYVAFRLGNPRTQQRLSTLFFSTKTQAMPSPAWLCSNTISWPMLTRQRYHQHNSITTSHHGQDHLGSIIASMTRQQYHATANIASLTWHWHHAAAKSPRQYHRQYDSTFITRHSQVASAAPSPAWLRGLAFSSPTSNSTRMFTADQALGLEEYHSNQ
jgi:hypothetical protein